MRRYSHILRKRLTRVMKHVIIATRISTIMEETFGDLPSYTLVKPDLTLIGVRHNGVVNPEKLAEFKKTLAHTDHLAMEGRRSLIALDGTYEAVVATSFGREIHFLDEDENDIKLAAEQGKISPELFEIYKILGRLPDILRETTNFNEILARVLDYVMISGEKNFPETFDVSKVVYFVRDNLMELFENKEKIELFQAAVQTLFKYFGHLRDHKVYHPKLARLSTKFEGKKTGILGAAHIKSLQELFSGQAKAILPWEGHVLTLDKGSQDGVRFVEGLYRE